MENSKKRILVLNYEFPPIGGGASPVSYEISKGYVKYGHEVDVVTMSYKGLSSFEKKEGFNIYRVKSIRKKKEMCSPVEQLSYLYSAKKFLKNHLKKFHYDKVHCHFIVPTGVLAKWIKKKYHIPYFITSHGSDVLGYNTKRTFRYIYPLIQNEWKDILKNADVVVTPSKYLEERILEKTEEVVTKVIPNGIQKGKFLPLKKKRSILAVARLFENKGLQDLILAVGNESTKLKLRKGEWSVDIVGEGPYRSQLEKLVYDLDLSDIIKFHGWIDNDSQKMKEFYGRAKIFISPSWFESFGLTVLESLSAGCYPILSSIPTYRQFDLPMQNYFEPRDSKKLGFLIENAIEEKNEIAIDIEKFYWKNILSKYNEILNE